MQYGLAVSMTFLFFLLWMQGRRKLILCGTVSHLKYNLFNSWGRGGSAENFGNLEPKSVHFIDSRGDLGQRVVRPAMP